MVAMEEEMKESTFFAMRGYVGKGIYRKEGNGWTLTNFLLGVLVGKDEKTGRGIYDNIPVVCWWDVPVAEGDEVFVSGTIKMKKKSDGKKFEIQLVAEGSTGVTFVKRGETSIGRNQEVPPMPEVTHEQPAEDNNYYADDNIPF